MPDSESEATATRKQSRAEIVKATSFKQVDGGYLFRAPNPKIIGRSDHYIVDEGQRSAIVDILAPIGESPTFSLSKVVGWSFLSLIVVAPLTGLLAMLDLPDPASAIVSLSATGVIAALVTVLLASLHRLAKQQRAALQPILAHATPTGQRISNADVMWASRTAGGPAVVRRNWRTGGVVSGVAAVVFLAVARFSWHGDEGTLAQLQTGFFVVMGLTFAAQSALQFYNIRGGHLPTSARRIDVQMKRVMIGIPVIYVAIVLVFAALQISGSEVDYAALRARQERKAAAGDAEAMTKLGWLYRDGKGVPQDYSKSRDWYEKAAANGDASAKFWVGWFYHLGRGVDQDYGKAREWFAKAADQGDASAMMRLAIQAQRGLGMEKDLAKAHAWYEKAAATGDTSGMLGLGTSYLNGLGVQQDYVKARAWFQKAADAGLAAAMKEIGTIYNNGWGVPLDPVKAREWFEKGATAGDLTAMQYAAAMLDMGKGGEADSARSAHLILHSAKLGHPWSKAILSGGLTFLKPSTRTELKRELTQLGKYHGAIDDEWNDEVRMAVADYLKSAR